MAADRCDQESGTLWILEVPSSTMNKV